MTTRGGPCRLPVAYVLDIPELGPHRLCGAHACTVRMRGGLPAPRAAKPPRVPTPTRELVRPTWSAEEDELLLAHAGEPAKAVVPLFLCRTVSAIHQRRATLRRGERA